MYSRQSAVEYAKKWWNKRNPNFYNFDDLGGDCTNFVNQCLYYGGITMLESPLGWFYKSLNYRSPSWAGVEEFFTFSLTNQNLKGVRAKQIFFNFDNYFKIEENFFMLDIGDVIQLNLMGEDRYHHTLLITKINKQNALFSNIYELSKNIFIACHTADAFDKCLADYLFADIRLLKILN